MATRHEAVYTNMFFLATHLFTRLRWPINFPRKLHPICALCIPPWISSFNIPLKAVCHATLWGIQQFGETKGCIVAFWVFNCFHSRTGVARSVWQNRTYAMSIRTQNQSNCHTSSTPPLNHTLCTALKSQRYYNTWTKCGKYYSNSTFPSSLVLCDAVYCLTRCSCARGWRRWGGSGADPSSHQLQQRRGRTLGM